MKSIYKRLTAGTALMLTVLALGACSPDGVKSDSGSSDKTEETAKSHDLKYVSKDGIITIGKEGAIPTSDIKKDMPKVTIYFDPMCPACAMYEAESSEFLFKQVEEGKIYVQYAPMMFLDKASIDQYSSRASAYTLGVAEYAPELVGKFIPKLMEAQPEEATGEATLTQDDFNKILKEVGGNDTQTDKINAAMKDNMELSYNSTLTMFKDNELLKLSPTGELFTPFVVPTDKDGKKHQAVDLIQGQLLSGTEKAVKEITE